MGKIILDDIFSVLNLIYKELPKKKKTLKYTNKLKVDDIIEFPISIKENIPPHNQSAMDGIGVVKKRKEYLIKGVTHLNRLIKKNIKDNECLIVKTGSLLPDNIKYIIPLERLFRDKNKFFVLNYKFKKTFLRYTGNIYKKNSYISKNKQFIGIKDFISIKSINNLKVGVIEKLKFKIISTGSEFTKKHFINHTNGEYICNFVKKYGHTVVQYIHLEDDQNKIYKEIKKSKSNITIVIGGTGKSKDDIDFKDINLQVDGLDLKPGRPFKFFSNKSGIFLFFPGNPCSSFVLTNIIIKSIFNYYHNKETKLDYDLININNLKYDFINLNRKSFLFASRIKDKIKIFSNQESSNLSNILKSNCLVYYDKTAKLKVYDLND